MRVVTISDTHTFEDAITVPNGDVLVHAGDATIAGTPEEVAAFGKWLEAQPHKHKIVIAGNHDWLFQKKSEQARYLIQFAGVHYLQDSSIEIEGVRFYGPPWGILDYIKLGKGHLGCEELVRAVARLAPRVHVFGHIHGGYGEWQLGGTHFINASICDEAYRPVNAPIVFEIEAVKAISEAA